MMFKSLYSKASNSDLPLLPLHNSTTSPASSHSINFADDTSLPPVITPQLPQSSSLLAISRQSKHLQSHLQTLLDAQSSGLLAELGANHPDEATSGSSSPAPTGSFSASTSQFYSGTSSTVPVRQPKPKKIGLRSARRGIAQTIKKLAELRTSEASILDEESIRRDGAISDIDALAAKSQDLRDEIEAIESQSANDRVHSLKDEEHALSSEIRELETRLFEMRARQKHMLREISALESGVQSKLSSYRIALELAQQDAREYLTHPPVDIIGEQRRRDGVWALPPARRTLELAKQQWTEDRKGLQEQKQSVLLEKQALEKGGKMWEEVVGQISTVEDLLRIEMQRLNGELKGATAEQAMHSILDRMRQVEKRLESFLDVAESNEWKLLVVAIGAELQALAEGGHILRNALGVVAEADGAMKEPANNSSDRDALFTNGTMLDRDEDKADEPSPDLLTSPHDS